MATWVTHLMIADRVLETVSDLDKHAFCVGSIAPDCNVENEDWTQFTPSREATHWMSGKRKVAADCHRFYEEMIAGRRHEIQTAEELSFLLGYFAHLVADAEFQRYIRDPERIAATWERIRKHPVLSNRAEGLSETWDAVKQLIGQGERMKDIYTMEAEYLETHPDSGYLTEILPLTAFPDYMELFPKGAIVRKIGVMGYLPRKEASTYPFVAMTREEYSTFLAAATKLVIATISKQGTTH